MNRIHVCSLARVERTLQETGASHVMTLLGPGLRIERPASIVAERHIRVGISDIVAADDGRILPEHERDGHILPEEAHILEIIDFARRWDELGRMPGSGRGALLIHCYAGVSRSTAAAYASLLALDPDRDEFELAHELRRCSPTASPNPRLIEIADRLLQREGRMVSAIRSIGRGVDCYEGVPFALDYGAPAKG